jgi:AhpD family alkylhydroperoxidase
MDERRRQNLVRVGLVVLALPQLAIGMWALVSPRGWFGTFPGAGRAWLPFYGPYDEHFVYDIASAFLALAVVLLVAAWSLNRRLVQLAAVAYLVFGVPHAIYHWGADARLPAPDGVVNGVGLALSLVVALGVLGLSRAAPPAPSAASRPAAHGRLGRPRGGLLARAARWYGRRRFGEAPATVDAYLHHPRLLMGYGTFETAVERSHRVDERLKSLAELKAAAVVGCEWCMDFGSWLARTSGVPERQLRELPRHRTSHAFSPVERVVVEYAVAMTRTPAEVDGELFARLREHFDDAQLVELTNVIAVENLRARFNHALDLEPQNYSEDGFCVVPESVGERSVAAGPAEA